MRHVCFLSRNNSRDEWLKTNKARNSGTKRHSHTNTVKTVEGISLSIVNVSCSLTSASSESPPFMSRKLLLNIGSEKETKKKQLHEPGIFSPPCSVFLYSAGSSSGMVAISYEFNTSQCFYEKRNKMRDDLLMRWKWSKNKLRLSTLWHNTNIYRHFHRQVT